MHNTVAVNVLTDQVCKINSMPFFRFFLSFRSHSLKLWCFRRYNLASNSNKCLCVCSGGIHSKKGKACVAVEDKIKKIEDRLESEKASLFPTQMSVANFPYTPDRVPRPNGGWGDLRDHSLCLNFTANFTHL